MTTPRLAGTPPAEPPDKEQHVTTGRTEMVAVIAVATVRGVDYTADINIPATEYDTDPGVRNKARINARVDLEDMLIESIPGLSHDKAFEYVMTGGEQTSRYWIAHHAN